jgi:hypothetical protein
MGAKSRVCDFGLGFCVECGPFFFLCVVVDRGLAFCA